MVVLAVHVEVHFPVCRVHSHGGLGSALLSGLYTRPGQGLASCLQKRPLRCALQVIVLKVVLDDLQDDHLVSFYRSRVIYVFILDTVHS